MREIVVTCPRIWSLSGVCVCSSQPSLKIRYSHKSLATLIIISSSSSRSSSSSSSRIKNMCYWIPILYFKKNMHFYILIIDNWWLSCWFLYHLLKLTNSCALILHLHLIHLHSIKFIQCNTWHCVRRKGKQFKNMLDLYMNKMNMILQGYSIYQHESWWAHSLQLS